MSQAINDEAKPGEQEKCIVLFLEAIPSQGPTKEAYRENDELASTNIKRCW